MILQVLINHTITILFKTCDDVHLYSYTVIKDFQCYHKGKDTPKEIPVYNTVIHVLLAKIKPNQFMGIYIGMQKVKFWNSNECHLILDV